jgi:hypothetical protein
MQISSSHSGFNFSSVYKSVVTHHSEPPAVVPQEVQEEPTASSEIASSDEGAKSENMHRETLMLKAANRVAERIADLMAATPDL